MRHQEVLDPCPAWCISPHDRAGMPHEGRTQRLAVNACSPSAEQWLEVRAVQYLPLDEDLLEGDWAPFVEIAHHADGRYRVVNVRPDDATDLARVLERCADDARQWRRTSAYAAR